MNIAFEGKRKFVSKVRGHEVVTDLPEPKGGDDAGPTPPELCVISLGTCIGVYAVSYLETAKLDPAGLGINIDWDYSVDKKRIGKVKVDITVPNAELGARKKGLLAAVDQCIIHNTFREHPEIEIEIKE